MKNMRIWIISAISLCLLMLNACKKDDDTSIQSAEDSAQIETEYSQIFDAISNYASTDPKTYKTESNILADGALVTFTDTTFDDGDGVDFTIDYGPMDNGTGYKGILCKDQRYRAGKIHVGITDRWSALPCTMTFAMSNGDYYFVGNGVSMFQLTGNAIIAHNTSEGFSFTVTNATLHRDNGTATWNSDRTMTLITNAHGGWLNNEYQLTGTAIGTNVNGEDFTVENTTPLLKRVAYGCLSTFISGELKITSKGKQQSINYDKNGNLECDRIITVDSKDITLW